MNHATHLNLRTGFVATVFIASLFTATASALADAPAATQPSQPVTVIVDWSKTLTTSKSTPTLQVVVNPPLRPGSVIHDGAYAAVHDLGADYVRYVPWLPYPRLAVAELQPPTPQKTSWDFSLIDPMTIDFFNAAAGHSTILNFSTIPQWMFITKAPVKYPDDPNKVFWGYEQGTELRDPTMKELGDYYARLVSWYVNGGFTDENGKFHSSGYHYQIPYWEVLNEVESEHRMTVQQYTLRYDAIVKAIAAVSPSTKFVGLALGSPKNSWFEYFLNPKNHQPGVPLDMISYHFYASPRKGKSADDWQYSFFHSADGFLGKVRAAEEIRKRLSPSTKTDLDELGVILPGDNVAIDDTATRIPPVYWNAAGAMYAYLCVELSKIGIDVVGESQLVGYPTQFPSVSMIDWKNGKPNARFLILKLLKDNFGPGDQLVSTDLKTADLPSPTAPNKGQPALNLDLEAQAFQTASGRKLLLINKRNSPTIVNLPDDAIGAAMDVIDLPTGENPPRVGTIAGMSVTLSPFAVAVVHWKQ